MSMVDIGDAGGRIKLKEKTIKAIRNNEIKKGEPLKVAETAALLAIKNTPFIIPHCHPIPITYASVDFSIEENEILCRCEVRAKYSTGVEMEALHGVSVALLTIWDMVKYLEKNERGEYDTTLIHDIKVVKKYKGE